MEHQAPITKYRKKKLQENPTLCTTCLKIPRLDPYVECRYCRERRAQQYQALKLEVFIAYGGPRCVCCGETELHFLCLDHVNNDRPKQCKELNWKNPSSGKLYGYLKRNNFPPGYQVLCWNCNRGKWSNGGVCPHNR